MAVAQPKISPDYQPDFSATVEMVSEKVQSNSKTFMESKQNQRVI